MSGLHPPFRFMSRVHRLQFSVEGLLEFLDSLHLSQLLFYLIIKNYSFTFPFFCASLSCILLPGQEFFGFLMKIFTSQKQIAQNKLTRQSPIPSPPQKKKKNQSYCSWGPFTAPGQHIYSPPKLFVRNSTLQIKGP